MKGSIELISASADVAGRPIAEYISDATKGKLPLDFLGTFLHEGTHFWCLNGPVGLAIASTLLQLHREFATKPEVMLVPELAPTHSRALLITRILEPLLEGLAQFAEFDLYTGPSAVCSPIALWTMAMFAHHADPRLESDWFARLRYLLMIWRTNEITIRRKSDSLVRPLTIENGGYLIGYLAVQNSWHVARQHSARLADPELFLMYFRSLIFDDHSLVEMLFDPPMDEYRDANRFLQHINDRLWLLRRNDLDERVGQFEAAIASRGGLEGCEDSIYIDNQCAVRSKQKLLKFVQDTALMGLNYKSEEIRKPETAIAIVDSGCLLSRQCFRIRVDAVNISVSNGVATVADDEVPLFKAKTYLGAQEGNYEGRLALYFLHRYMVPALVCTSKNLVVCAYIPSDSTEEMDNSTREALVGAMAQALFASDFRQTINSLVYHDPFEEVDFGEYQKFIPKIWPVITNMYLNHALRFVADKKLHSCLAIMKEHGFWNLLSESKDSPAKKAERVRALAAIGLITSYVTDSSSVSEILKAQGVAFDEIVSDLQHSFDTNGYQTIRMSDDLRHIGSFV